MQNWSERRNNLLLSRFPQSHVRATHTCLPLDSCKSVEVTVASVSMSRIRSFGQPQKTFLVGMLNTQKGILLQPGEVCHDSLQGPNLLNNGPLCKVNDNPLVLQCFSFTYGIWWARIQPTGVTIMLQTMLELLDVDRDRQSWVGWIMCMHNVILQACGNFEVQKMIIYTTQKQHSNVLAHPQYPRNT